MNITSSHRTLARVISFGSAALLLGWASWFLLLPGITVVRDVSDPALREGGIPRAAWRLHEKLTPAYESWARERIASGDAARVHYLNVPGTEWPLFGSVFYLWATEHLQAAWDADPTLAPVAPAVRARGTIEACKDLLLDPAHHTWVRIHYGEDYLHHDNVFFRSLLIAGLTTYEKLTGTGETLDILRDQVETLSADFDASPYGVLDDYPGECYPIDCFAAVAWIRRADAVLGTDHSAFVTRQRRAFTGDRLDADGLIPWRVDPNTGRQHHPSRGIVNTHVLIFARELYPDLADRWYRIFEREFWQDRWFGAGWREFYRSRPDSEWTFDVDAGPIIGGFSPSASGFGMAAARVNGRLDHAYTLSAQALAVSWPLPGGRLLGPRTLSDPEHAPYLGEVAILWLLAEPVGTNTDTIVHGGRLAGPVHIALAVFFGGTLLAAWVALTITRRRAALAETGGLGARFLLWLLFVICSLVLLAEGSPASVGAAVLLAILTAMLGRSPPRSDPAEGEG